MATEVEWRRKWKPGLEAFPWQPIRIKDETYLLKYQFTSSSYKVLLTDLTDFWNEELSDRSLQNRIKDLNPGIEAPLVRILDKIKSVLDKTQDNPQTTFKLQQKRDRDGESIMLLSIKSQLADMPFVWNFRCKLADRSMAKDHLTLPLMAMVCELTRRQQELIKIIESKDKQIEDYKSQGAKCSRKHIETPTFVETAFEMSMMTSKSFDNHMKDVEMKTFDAKNQDMYRQIMSKRAWINSSPVKGKPDTDSFVDEAVGADGQQKSSSSSSSWGNSRLPPSLQNSPTKSAQKTPSPSKSSDTTPDTSPVKDPELMRRQELERKLEMEENKKMEKAKKKKKKIGF